MNNFEIEIKEWYGRTEANAGINKYIKECAEQGLEIVDITSHVTEEDASFTYTFIFKLKWNKERPRKKVWDDERWD